MVNQEHAAPRIADNEAVRIASRQTLRTSVSGTGQTIAR